jgi:ribose transport system substrate-binding protein
MLRRLSKIHGVWVLIAAGLLISCEKPYSEQKVRYFFVATNVNLPYWQEAKAGFMDEARNLQVKVEFDGPNRYAPEEEVAAFKKALATQPFGILIAPTQPDLLKGPIDDAIRQGIPVICVDSDVPDSKRNMFIGTDNVDAGMQSGERIAEILHGQGTVVVITIPGQHNLDRRMEGLKEAFKMYPKVKILETFDDRGDPVKANDEISRLLEAKKEFDGVVCLEASGGPGAAEALHRLNMGGKVPIVAMDKDPETLDWISRGVINATIAQKPYTMSFYGLRFLYDLHHNIVHEFKDWRTAPASPLPTRVDTGTAVIDSSNLADFRAAQSAQPSTHP